MKQRELGEVLNRFGSLFPNTDPAGGFGSVL
jgi:hypothetical protein